MRVVPTRDFPLNFAIEADDRDVPLILGQYAIPGVLRIGRF